VKADRPDAEGKPDLKTAATEPKESSPGGREEKFTLAGRDSRDEARINAGMTHPASVFARKLPAGIMPHVINAVKNMTPGSSRVTVIRLVLEPKNMGEIEIRLSYSNSKGELTAHFFTTSGQVKDAVEYSLPQLKEALAQHNINLGEAAAFVGQEKQGQKGTYPNLGHGAQPGFNNGGVSGGNAGQPAGPGGSWNNGRTLDLLV
jgi:flagellar hook-length control protein FliK